MLLYVVWYTSPHFELVSASVWLWYRAGRDFVVCDIIFFFPWIFLEIWKEVSSPPIELPRARRWSASIISCPGQDSIKIPPTPTLQTVTQQGNGRLPPTYNSLNLGGDILQTFYNRGKLYWGRSHKCLTYEMLFVFKFPISSHSLLWSKSGMAMAASLIQFPLNNEIQ